MIDTPVAAHPFIAQPVLNEKQKIVLLIREESILNSYPFERAIRIAMCESGLNPNAKNSSSTASGIFQFIKSTWATTESGQGGLSPLDYKANIHEALTLLGNGGERHWYVSRNCWDK